MIPPLVEETLRTGLQTCPTTTEGIKIFALPATLIALVHCELLAYGFNLPKMEDGDALVLNLSGVGEVELVPATVH